MKKLMILALAGAGAVLVKKKLDEQAQSQALWSAARTGASQAPGAGASGAAVPGSNAAPSTKAQTRSVWAQATDSV